MAGNETYCFDLVGVGVRVRVGGGLVGVPLRVGVRVGVLVGVQVTVGVRLDVAVLVGVWLDVGVLVGVRLDVGVLVGVWLRVAVGVLHSRTVTEPIGDCAWFPFVSFAITV